MLAYSDSQTFDMFIFALICVGGGGSGVYISWMHLGNLFPSQKAMFISIVVGMLTFGSIVYAIIDEIISQGFFLLYFAFFFWFSFYCEFA